jgi:hypothetical protein
VSADQRPDDGAELSLAARDALVHLLLDDLATPGAAGVVACARALVDGEDAAALDQRLVAAATGALRAASALSAAARHEPGATAAARVRLAAYAELLAVTTRGDTLPARLEQARRMFARGLFFEVHEVLEPPWRDAAGSERTILQGVIQAAVAWHHARRHNDGGARRLASAALDKLGAAPDRWLGFPVRALRSSLRAFLDGTSHGAAPPLLAWAADDASG